MKLRDLHDHLEVVGEELKEMKLREVEEVGEEDHFLIVKVEREGAIEKERENEEWGQMTWI